jgi:hypothetical protein
MAYGLWLMAYGKQPGWVESFVYERMLLVEHPKLPE